MPKKKLKKFAETATFEHVIQPTRDEAAAGISLKGNWRRDVFKNDHPIVVELGCGRGEYTVGLAKKYPDVNFIGVDIKGARIWKGAKESKEAGMSNVAFLRTQIELIEGCFGEGEIDEIWITFPDPQIKFKRMKHRMLNPTFLNRYQKVLKPEGVVHLKSDSEFLHGYLHGVLQILDYPVYEAYHDIHEQLVQEPDHLLFTIQTYYEKIWLKQGKAITYIKFGFPQK